MNKQRNGFEQSKVVQGTVWRETGTVSFASTGQSASSDQGTGQAAIGGDVGRTIQIQAFALDDFVKDARPPDLIKCDVEGAEVEVFHGAAKLLASHQPSIVCEIHSAENGRVLREEFARLGNTVRDLYGNHICAEPAQT